MTVHTGPVVEKRTTVLEIRPEILPLIGSAIILGRDIQLLDKIGQGMYKKNDCIAISHIYMYSARKQKNVELTLCHAMHIWKHKVVGASLSESHTHTLFCK